MVASERSSVYPLLSPPSSVVGRWIWSGPGSTQSRRSSDLGIAELCLRRWLKADDVQAGGLEGITGDERAELVELRRRSGALEMEVETLKRA